MSAGWWLVLVVVVVVLAPLVAGAVFDKGARAGWLVVLAVVAGEMALVAWLA